MTDAVPGFDVTTCTHEGRTYEVYRAGSGPAVIVIHEMPGLHPGVTAFGQRLVDAGYRVYMPSLFGRPGAPFGGRDKLP
jgi:dienelactone hydrolase